MDSEKIIKRLVAIRLSKQITKKDLAKKIDMHQATLWRIETSRQDIKLSELIAYCKVLEISLGDVVGDECSIEIT